MRKRLQALQTEKQNQLLVSTSVLQSYQDELERMRTQVKLQEEDNITRVNKKKDVSREFTQIIQATRNLYGRCVSTMQVKTMFTGQRDNSNLSDMLDQELDMILTRILDLIEITQEYQVDLNAGSTYGGSSGLPNTSSILLGEKESMASLPTANLNSHSGSKVSLQSLEKSRK